MWAARQGGTKIPETAEADLLEDGFDPDADVELHIDDEFDAEIDHADDVTVEVVAEFIEFELGHNVVYPHHGAGKVCAKEIKEVFGERREYLTIKILHNDMTVMVPTENATLAGLRRVIDEETMVQKVLDVLRDDVSDMPKNWNRRFKHNRDKIKTGDIYELSEVVRNLALREHEKGLSSGEKQMYTRAKKILASELMYALDKSEVGSQAHLDELLSRSSDAETSGGSSVAAGEREEMAVALVVAAGQGERLGSERPKALVSLGGRLMWEWSTAALHSTPMIDEIVVALPPGVSALPGVRCVTGGAVRSESVRNALAAVASDADPILVHDAARPSLPELIEAVLAGLEGVDAAIAAAPVTDTTKECGDDHIVLCLQRSRLWAVQRRRRSFAEQRSSARFGSPTRNSPRPPTRPALVERHGGRVRALEVAAPRENLKVTTPSILLVAEQLLVARQLIESRTLTDYHVHLRRTSASTRPPSSTSRALALSATARRLGAAGIGEARPSTCTASARRSRSGTTRWRKCAHDEPLRLLRVRARGDGPAPRPRGRLHPGARGPDRDLIERCELDYAIGSVHFLGDFAVDYARYDVWHSGRSPEQIGDAATSRRWPQPLAVASTTSSRTPTSSRSGRSATSPGGATCAATTPARDRGDRRGRVAVEVSTAGSTQTYS